MSYIIQKDQSKQVTVSELSLEDSIISETDCAKNLGAWMDSSVSVERHVNELCKTCLIYINWIRNIRSCLTIAITKNIVQELINSRINYCNTLLFGLPSYQINKIQRTMKISTRLIFSTKRPQYFLSPHEITLVTCGRSS